MPSLLKAELWQYCSLCPSGGLDICRENSKVNIFSLLFLYFCKVQRGFNVNCLLILYLVQETSAWRLKLTCSVIVQENGKERRPVPSWWGRCVCRGYGVYGILCQNRGIFHSTSLSPDISWDQMEREQQHCDFQFLCWCCWRWLGPLSRGVGLQGLSQETWFPPARPFTHLWAHWRWFLDEIGHPGVNSLKILRNFALNWPW